MSPDVDDLADLVPRNPSPSDEPSSDNSQPEDEPSSCGSQPEEESPQTDVLAGLVSSGEDDQSEYESSSDKSPSEEEPGSEGSSSKGGLSEAGDDPLEDESSGDEDQNANENPFDTGDPVVSKKRTRSSPESLSDDEDEPPRKRRVATAAAQSWKRGPGRPRKKPSELKVSQSKVCCRCCDYSLPSVVFTSVFPGKKPHYGYHYRGMDEWVLR